MMTVAIKLQPDRFGGIGVFAAAFIPAGTIVWKRMPHIDVMYTVAELEAMPEEVKPFFDKYVYPVYGKRRALLGYELNLDHGKFVNHAEEPTMIETADDNIMVASRDIAEGEELTCDYRVWGEDLGF